MIKRLLPHPGLSVMLLIVWLLMANSITFGGVVLGTLFGLALPKFTEPFWPDRPAVAVRRTAARLSRHRVARHRNCQFSGCRADPVPPQPRSALALAGHSDRPDHARGDHRARRDDQPDSRHGLVGRLRRRRYLLVHALDVADEAAEIARIKARYEARLQRVFK